MPQLTLKDLNEAIDLDAVQDEARQKFESQQRAKRGLNDWLVSLMPVFLLLVFIAFYLLSAPHTVSLLNRITPGWGWVSPIGLELCVVVVAAARQLKWRTFENWLILVLLLGMSIAINVAGGFIAVVRHDTATIGTQNMQSLLATYPGLVAEQQIVLLLVIPIGVLIPIMGKFAGEIIIKIATGEIKFESINIEDLWIKERASVMKAALIRAAIKNGAGTRTAGSWAQRIIDELFDDDDEHVDAVSGLSHHVPSAPTFPKVHAEMGFASFVPPQMDTQNIQDTGTRETVLRAKLVTQWVNDNPDRLHEMLAQPGARRGVSRAISQAIAGSPGGYKTVERVLKSMGIEF